MEMEQSRSEWLPKARIESLLNTFGANAVVIARLVDEKQDCRSAVQWQEQVRNEIIRRTQV